MSTPQYRTPRREPGASASTSAEDMLRTGTKQIARFASDARDELSATAQSMGRAATKAGRSALEKIRENPMPVALAGIGVACTGAGIAWLLMSGAKAAAAAKGGDGAQSMPGNGSTRARRIKQSIKHAGEAAGTKASELAHGAAAQGRRLEGAIEETLQAHPLATGAALLAVGTAIGLALPRTKIEDGFLGRERDKLVSSAQRVARSAAKKVENIARQVAEPSATQH